MCVSSASVYQHMAPLPAGSVHVPASISHFCLFITALTPRNIVPDCEADAIIPSLYLHNHISHLHSWALKRQQGRLAAHWRGQSDGGPPGDQAWACAGLRAMTTNTEGTFLPLTNGSLSLHLPSAHLSVCQFRPALSLL